MSSPPEAAETAAKPSRGVAAVDRALRIVAALEAEPMPRTLSELSRATDMHKSTILRLLESLQDAGYVVKVEGAKYALGPTVMRLGMAYERTNPLRHQILPVMRRLVERGTESPSFHIRQSPLERLCLFRLDSNHPTLDRVHAGDRLPLHRGAAGKVLLAFGHAPAEGEAMERIRRECFAVSLGERDPSCAGVAAPVFSGQSLLLGALSLSGPRERFRPIEVEAMREPLIEAARELSEALGGRFPL